MPKPAAPAEPVVEEETPALDESSPDHEQTVGELQAQEDTASTDTDTTDAPADDATPPEPSAEELKTQLAEARAENERLKAAPAEPPAPAQPAGGIKDLYTQHFLTKTMPEVKKVLLDEKSTPDQRFQATYDMANHLVGAVLKDQIQPGQANLAVALIETQNEVESLKLERADARYKDYATEVEKELGSLKWTERADKGIVQKIFHRLVGAKSNGKGTLPVVPARSAPPVKVLKDISAGTGVAPTKSTSTGLTAEQEEDRQQIENESPNPFPAKLYLAKLKARQNTFEVENKGKPDHLKRKIPTTLRGI